MIAADRDSTAASAVVDQGVDGFLEHSLFIADDDGRSVDLHEVSQTVVSVDDTSVKIVKIGSCPSAAVELDHRSEIRRQDRKDSDDHPAGFIAGSAESFDELKLLGNFSSSLGRSGMSVRDELGTHLFEIDILKEL